MIDYSIYNLPKNLSDELLKLNIDFVFQPIYTRDNTIYAYEALMRPSNGSVIDLIDEYTKSDNLHTLEFATVIGAIQKYTERGYTEFLHVNSFPSEYLSVEECNYIRETYPALNDRVVIEILEYLNGHEQRWSEKRPMLEYHDMLTAIDDFGTGINDTSSIDYYKPNVIKFDRSLISEIDTNPIKQAYAKDMIKTLHMQEYYLVAEGIETKEEYDYLMSIGFDLFQGYYFGMPQ